MDKLTITFYDDKNNVTNKEHVNTSYDKTLEYATNEAIRMGWDRFTIVTKQEN